MKAKLIDINNISVKTADTLIIKNINLSIYENQVIVLFGPNGSGKTTLIRTIMGFSGQKLINGKILFKGRELNRLPIEKRAAMGIGIMHQHPPKIRGITLNQIANYLCDDKKKVESLAKKLNLDKFLDREINTGLSGGEVKRAELFQILIASPDLLLLDEPESGVDIENISLMGTVINDYIRDLGKSALTITHTGHILDYIKADQGYVIMNGEFWCHGAPEEIFSSIKRDGYEKCKDCRCLK